MRSLVLSVLFAALSGCATQSSLSARAQSSHKDESATKKAGCVLGDGDLHHLRDYLTLKCWW